jgi:peptide/nickel transport system substrate-binding protein
MQQADSVERLLNHSMNRRTLLARAAIAGATLGTLLAACETDDDDAVDDDPGIDPDDDTDDDEPVDDTDDEVDDDADDTPEDDRYGGEIVALGHHEIESLSPDDSGPTVHWTMITNIHDALLAIDFFFELENELAEDYEITEDGMQYTFYLREGVLFHDGEPFTADDVVYTYEFHMDPENATISSPNYAEIESVEAPDDYTFVVNMRDPDASFLRFGATGMIVPEHHHSAIGEDAYKSDPIGTGPFYVDEYRPAEFCRLAAFEDHWRGRPYADFFTERIIPEGSVRTLELQTGEADVIVWPPVIDDVLELVEDPEVQSFWSLTPSINHFSFNNQHEVLSDRAVRRAVMYAVDRQQIIDDVFLGAATVATANLVPTLDPYYNPDVTIYEYDPAMAEEVLEEAGWVMGDNGVREKDGVACEWVCQVITGDQARLPQAETVQAYLADVGINMIIEEAPFATIQENQREGRIGSGLYNWTYGGWNGEPDGVATLHSEARNNFNLWRNERVDELLAEGLRLVDPEDRKGPYHEIQEIVAEEVPMLYFSFWDWYGLWHQRIRGLPEETDGQQSSNLLLHVRDYWIEE